MKKFTKLLSVILAASMIFSSMPLNALADEVIDDATITEIISEEAEEELTLEAEEITESEEAKYAHDVVDVGVNYPYMENGENEYNFQVYQSGQYTISVENVDVYYIAVHEVNASGESEIGSVDGFNEIKVNLKAGSSYLIVVYTLTCYGDETLSISYTCSHTDVFCTGVSIISENQIRINLACSSCLENIDEYVTTEITPENSDYNVATCNQAAFTVYKGSVDYKGSILDYYGTVYQGEPNYDNHTGDYISGEKYNLNGEEISFDVYCMGCSQKVGEGTSSEYEEIPSTCSESGKKVYSGECEFEAQKFCDYYYEVAGNDGEFDSDNHSSPYIDKNSIRVDENGRLTVNVYCSGCDYYDILSPDTFEKVHDDGNCTYPPYSLYTFSVTLPNDKTLDVNTVEVRESEENNYAIHNRQFVYLTEGTLQENNGVLSFDVHCNNCTLEDDPTVSTFNEHVTTTDYTIIENPGTCSSDATTYYDIKSVLSDGYPYDISFTVHHEGTTDPNFHNLEIEYDGENAPSLNDDFSLRFKVHCYSCTADFTEEVVVYKENYTRVGDTFSGTVSIPSNSQSFPFEITIPGAQNPGQDGEATVNRIELTVGMDSPVSIGDKISASTDTTGWHRLRFVSAENAEITNNDNGLFLFYLYANNPAKELCEVTNVSPTASVILEKVNEIYLTGDAETSATAQVNTGDFVIVSMDSTEYTPDFSDDSVLYRFVELYENGTAYRGFIVDYAPENTTVTINGKESEAIQLNTPFHPDSDESFIFSSPADGWYRIHVEGAGDVEPSGNVYLTQGYTQTFTFSTDINATCTLTEIVAMPVNVDSPVTVSKYDLFVFTPSEDGFYDIIANDIEIDHSGSQYLTKDEPFYINVRDVYSTEAQFLIKSADSSGTDSSNTDMELGISYDISSDSTFSFTA
ncbi:MAG: hypothetical protein Q4C42_10965, partial [Clostridia bacterium]|nr:hypothetical protein [Clostridia bacterium]